MVSATGRFTPQPSDTQGVMFRVMTETAELHVDIDLPTPEEQPPPATPEPGAPAPVVVDAGDRSEHETAAWSEHTSRHEQDRASWEDRHAELAGRVDHVESTAREAVDSLSSDMHELDRRLAVAEGRLEASVEHHGGAPTLVDPADVEPPHVPSAEEVEDSLSPGGSFWDKLVTVKKKR